jgi:hypothetical protein
MEINGLDPDRVSRLEALATDCRLLLRGKGNMASVQELLSGRGVGVMDSIIVTVDLLEPGPDRLRQAKQIVLSAPLREQERSIHEALVDDLLIAAADLQQDDHGSGRPGSV